jgi:hypothetical protein
VLESYTLQVLPPETRARAIPCLIDLLGDGGLLLIIARGRDEHESEGQMPWPLLRRELEEVTRLGMSQVLFEDYFDDEPVPVRRFRALFAKAI